MDYSAAVKRRKTTGNELALHTSPPENDRERKSIQIKVHVENDESIQKLSYRTR